MEEVLKVLPEELKNNILKIGSSGYIMEIRLRVNRNVIVITNNIEVFVDYVISLNDLLQILIKISKNSIYAIQNDINNGFVVLKGGHRIGICGEVVLLDGKIKNIKNINSMNIRISKQIIGCADVLMKNIIEDGILKNTLIVSAPGCGKTTILRDAIRQISNGVRALNFLGNNIGVVDERGEIASVCNGNCNLDVGVRTDIMSNCPKYLGMQMLVRSMGISVIATDEIGSREDIDAIKYAALSGVKLIFTMHGKSIEDVQNKTGIKELIDKKLFERIVILSSKRGPGIIEKVHVIN